MEWLSVSKCMPVEMEQVLLFDENEGITVGYLYRKERFVQSCDGLTLGKVQYWMPLPETPLKSVPLFLEST